MNFYRKAADKAAKLTAKVKSGAKKVTAKVKDWGKRTVTDIKHKFSYLGATTKVQGVKAARDSWRQTKQVLWRTGDVAHTVFIVLPSMLIMGVYFVGAYVFDLVSRIVALATELWVSAFDITAHLLGLVDMVAAGLLYLLLIAPIAFIIAKLRRRGYTPPQSWKPNYSQSVNSIRWTLTPAVIIPLVALTPFLGWAEVRAQAADWNEKSNWWASSIVEEHDEPVLNTVVDLASVRAKEHTIPSPVEDEKVYTEDEIVNFIQPGTNLADHDEVHTFKNQDGSVHVLVIGLDNDYNFDMSAEDAENTEQVQARVAGLRKIVNQVVPAQSEGYTAKPSDYDFAAARNRHDRSYLYGRAYVCELFNSSGEELLKPQRAHRVWSLLYKKVTTGEGNYDIAQLRRGFEEELKLIKDSVSSPSEPTTT